MSKQTLECLRSISFLKKDNSVADLRRIPQDELKQKLAHFYESRMRNANREVSGLVSLQSKHSALISSVSSANAVIPHCTKLLTIETLYVDDPLLKLASPQNEMSKMEHEGLGIASDDSVDLAQLMNKLQYFSVLAPYIEAGFLHTLPLGALHEPPKELPFFIPKNLYRDLVPDDAKEFVRKSAIVKPMEQSPAGIIILSRPNTERKRQVSITFEADEASNHGLFYCFRRAQVESVGPDGAVRFIFDPWNDEPLEKAQYDIWIEQSINKTIGVRLESISKEMQIAEALGAPYLTESTFEANLLARTGQPVSSTSATAINFLQANSHLLNLEDPEAIYRLRTDHAELLNRFRLSVAMVSEELSGLDGDDFEERAQRLFEREVQPQIAEVNTAIGRIHSAAAKGLLQTGSALILGLLTGSALPVAALLSLSASGVTSEALPAIGDYQRLRKQPQFIWHKLRK